MRKLAIIVVAFLCLSGCSTLSNFLGGTQTSGETESGYTYVPVDPFPVNIVAGPTCKDPKVPFEIPPGQLLVGLPDNAVRVLIESFDLSGNVTYGTSKTGVKGELYHVTIDYINVDTINVRVLVKKTMRAKQKFGGKSVTIDDVYSPGIPGSEPGSEHYDITQLPDRKEGEKVQDGEFNIPIYVGVGLRLSANVNVVGASANI